MRRKIARGQARAGRPRPPGLDRVRRRRPHLRVSRQPQIVVGAEDKDLLAVQQCACPVPPVQSPQSPAQVAPVQGVQIRAQGVVQIGHGTNSRVTWLIASWMIASIASSSDTVLASGGKNTMTLPRGRVISPIVLARRQTRAPIAASKG